MEVIQNQITGVAEEMLLTLIRASYSPNIKQRGDCSAAILSVTGEILAQAPGAPIHLGSMLGTVKSILRLKSLDAIRQGDVYVANDPYTAGGQHLPDINVVAPVFSGGKCVAFLANIAHHADIGGMLPGSEGIVCRTIFQEGLRIPPTRLVREGELSSDVLEMILINSRTPDERRGDLLAQIAANTVGQHRFEEVLAKYGDETTISAMSSYLDATEKRFLSALRAIPDGKYSANDSLDPDIYDDDLEPIRISLTIRKSERGLRFDFTGTSKQVVSARNAPFNAVASTIYVMVKTMIDPELPANSGYFRALEIDVPSGSVLNPTPGAAVGARIFACAVLGDVVARALSKAIPGKALAGSAPHQHVNFSGTHEKGEVWVDYETIAGAYGARASNDGMDSVRIHMSGTLNLPVEALEHAFPLRVERYALRPDSGGHGRFRGGLGVVRDYRALGRMTVSLSGERQVSVAKGMAGGHDGAAGQFVLNPDSPEEQVLPRAVGERPLQAGDVLSVRTPGGAGLGNPRDRDRSAVERDVREGRVSPRMAARAYGFSRHRLDSEIGIDRSTQLRE